MPRLEAKIRPQPKRRIQWGKVTPEELTEMGWKLSVAKQIIERRRWQMEVAPRVGAEAPDFALEKLTATGRRTGEFLTLSSLREKPVALIFGSYT